MTAIEQAQAEYLKALDRLRTLSTEMATGFPATVAASTPAATPTKERGEGRIFHRKGSPFLWISYYVGGKEYRESSGSTDEEKAKKMLRRRLGEAAADRLGARAFVGPQQERVKVRDLLDALEADYRLREKLTPQAQSHLTPIRDAFGDRRAMNVTEETLDRYIAVCLNEGLARATVNRRLQLLGQAFRLAVRRKILSYAPAIRRLPETGNARQGFFEDAEFRSVVEHLPSYLKDFARFAYLTGWRKGEITSLTWADVDMTGRVIRLRSENSKNGQGRVAALEGELWSITERRRKAREVPTRRGETLLSHYVFHLRGCPVGDFRQSWASACKAANVEGRLFHDLRRTAVRNMVRAGVPERVAMMVSGHKTRSIFDRYNIVSEADLRSAVQKTETYLRAQPAEATVVAFGGSKRKAAK